MQIRQISADERTDVMFPLQVYAFEPTPADDEAREAYRRRMAFYGTVTSLVAEEDGQALACVGALPMEQNVRGRVLDMAIGIIMPPPPTFTRGFPLQIDVVPTLYATVLVVMVATLGAAALLPAARAARLRITDALGHI